LTLKTVVTECQGGALDKTMQKKTGTETDRPWEKNRGTSLKMKFATGGWGLNTPLSCQRKRYGTLMEGCKGG